MPDQALHVLLTTFRECFGDLIRVDAGEEFAARTAITTHFDECCDAEWQKGYKQARQTITSYELKPLTDAKNNRLDAHVAKLLQSGHAVTSFEDEAVKKVVGVRVVKDNIPEVTP